MTENNRRIRSDTPAFLTRPAAPANDPVSHPTHYTQGKIELYKFINDKNLNFNRGNAIKYIIRAGLKDPQKEIEDLQKAKQYIDFEIERIMGGQ